MDLPIPVGILLFDGVEVLDFAGPYEVFTRCGRDPSLKPFQVFTVAPATPVKARDGLRVIPDFLLEQAPPISILIVPGGPGARREMLHPKLMTWLRHRAGSARTVLSVCTGALLLAKAGLVEGMELTTHHRAIEELKALVPEAKILEGCRYVDNGKILMSAGVASGIDLSLYAVGKLLGPGAAKETADSLEYKN